LKGASSAVNDAKDPLSVTLADFNRDLAVNTTSAFVAAQQAVLGFEQLPESASKTFIYTGNITNIKVIPQLLDSGVGKSGAAHIIQSAAAAYKERGFKYVTPYPYLSITELTKSRFYYADERNADGSPAYGKVDGEAHGKHYLHLAEGKSQEAWLQTFVKGGVGYKKFEDA
jgi:hypothetical protein